MNATDTIFALALASNHQPEQHFFEAYRQLHALGHMQCSAIYLMPCRDGVGADYYNAACLLTSRMTVEDLVAQLKHMEQASGRVRPSHQISLDVDLIAWGEDLSHMQFNLKKLPLALDVKIPMNDLWSHPAFSHAPHFYRQVELDEILT